jgi:hypothetical protein
MADFDPDAYLANPAPTGSSGGFDPDAYLKGSSTPPKGDFGWGQAITDIPSEIGNEFSAGMKTAAEGFELPKPGVSGALENLGKTAMAPLGMGRAAFSWLTGPIKSVVGHGMANAEHLVGENVVNPIAKNVFGVPEEKLQHPDPNEMYETAKGDVDKALSAARPAGAPIKGPAGWSWDHPPTPPTTGPKPVAPVVQAADRISAIAPEPIDVPKAFASDSTAVQRVGQTLRNLPIVGDTIPQATGKMAGQLEGAQGAIASNYGQGSGPNVASRVGATISNAADAERSAAEQDALNSNTSVLNAWQRAQDDALHQVTTDENTALTQARAATGDMTPQEMGQQIITNLRRTEREAQNRKNDLYNTADQLGATVQANAVRGVHGFVSDVLAQEGRVSPLTNQMDPMLQPASHSMMQELRGLSDAMAPVRDPDTGRFSRPPPVSVSQLEQIRKRLGNIAQSANNDGDRAAARIIMNSFDSWEGHAFDNALFSGSPDALNAVREARAANRSWRQGFYNDRDDADKIINKVVTGEVTPQEMSNWLVGSSQVGSKGTSSRMLTRIAQVTNGDPATMDTIRAGVANRLFGTTEGATARAPERVASDINQFFNGTGSDVARRLYTPQQRQAALNYANAVRRGQEARETITASGRLSRPTDMPADVGPMQELAQAVLGKNGKTDEALFNAIDSYARSGGRGDIQTLADILRTIPAKDKGDLAGAIVRNLGQSEQTKGFSLDKFATDWGKYTPQAKDLLFGNAGQHRQALDDIATISQRYKEVGRRFGNPSGTGQTVGGLGELLWIVFHPFTAIPTLAGGAVAARMLSAPASARQTATLMSRALDMAKSQTAGNAARLNFAWNNFAKSAVNFGASPGILRFTQGGPQGPGTSNAKDRGRGDGRIYIPPGKAKGGTVTDPVDELADEMIQDAKRFAGFKKGGSPASFDERWDAAYPFGQLSPNIEDRRNTPEYDPEKDWPKYPPRSAQPSAEPITPLGDQMGAGVLDRQLPGFADGGTPTADPDPAFGDNSLVDQAHTQLNTQAERLPPPMSDQQVMMSATGMPEAPDDRPQWIQRLADNTTYQPWWNRVAMSGATLAHDVMTGQEPMLIPGMRREMYTDVPPPTGPTEDSTWLGKKLGLPPVAWDPNDPVIERAQDMAALAGTGGLGNTEEGAVLNATPSLRPALKYEGKIYKAPPNGEHLDALPAHLQGEFQRQAMSGEDIPNFQFGFMNHKGQFLNRDQALEYGLKEGLIDPRDARYGTLTSTMLSDTSKPGAAMSALEGESHGIQGVNGQAGAGRGAASVEEAQAAAERHAGTGQPLPNLPTKAMKIGDEYFVPGPIGKIRDIAADYMRTRPPEEHSMPFPDQYHAIDPQRSKAIADAFEQMEHNPNDPRVKASYQAMINETKDQFQHLMKSGLKIEPISQEMGDPYALNPRLAAKDVAENDHLWFFPTESGYGKDVGNPNAVKAISDNPMLQPSGITLNGQPLLNNDLFRVVHDYFGHLKEGYGFRAAGEDNAWRSHAAMYSDQARPAMTSETRGQNSWVNYGPHGETNRTASAADTVYADQKVGVMPDWTMSERYPGQVLKSDSSEPGAALTAFERSTRRNPGRAQLAADMKKSGELRGLVDDSGVYTWDAAAKTHHDAAKDLGLNYNIENRFHLTPEEDGYHRLDIGTEWTHNPEKVLSNPHLTNLLSNDKVLIDGENGQGLVTGPEFLKTLRSDTNQQGAALSGAEHASPFYSAVEKTVDNSPQSKMQGVQWANWLKNQPGVKQEELEWSGLDDWLRGQKGPVTKDQVQGYLKQNPTEIQEITRGNLDMEAKGKALAEKQGWNWNDLSNVDRNRYIQTANGGRLTEDIGGTKYHNWQLPGGENYREHLLTLPDRSEAQLLREEAERRGYGDKISQWPDKEFAQRYRDKVTNATDTGTYKSSHWDEPNVLAHVRTNDRDVGGKPALHLEEIQSDWHQAGRKNGYAQDIPQVQAYYETNGQRVPIGGGKTEAEALASSGDWPKTLEQIGLPIKYETTYRKGTGVPDAPFKTSWPELALKRMVRMAAEEGKDRISWTPGEAQAARYDLSKQVKDLRVVKEKDGNYSLSYTPKGRYGERIENFTPMTDKPIPAEKLPDYIGKDLAEKIVQDKSIDRPGTGTLSGEDLRVGGEGMKGFYDQMLPKMAEKMGKQYGVKVKEGSTPGGKLSDEDNWMSGERAMEITGVTPAEWKKNSNNSKWREDLFEKARLKLAEQKGLSQPVHYFDIPPKMKEDALKKGFSLFSDSSKPGAAVAGAEGSQNSSLWHGISQIKLPKPISEMSAVHTATGPSGERIIRPADLQGGNLLPLMGDRSGAGSMLHQVNGTPFQNPVEMQGGHGFMPANADTGAAWASAKPMASGIANRVKKLGEDNPTYGMYTAMGERSIDFSHHMSDTLAEMLKGAKITRDNKAAFDRAMRTDSKDFKAVSDWPGVGSKKLREYLANSPGNTKSKFAKLMDSRTFQDAGFPSVAEARFATTDPRLLHQPTGASGLAVAKMDPSGRIFEAPDQHRTYESNVAGSYVGGLPTSVPKEIMYPKMIKSLENYRDNLPGYKPTTDYLMARTPKGLPVTEPADQQWVDSVSHWLKERGYSGLKQGGAANNKENIPWPVKAEKAENVPARARGGRIEASNINHTPSEAQKEAGNYSKDHVNIHGLSFTVENAKGKHRSGIGKDGKEWKVKMPAHYGYIKRTEGADGDHVDVYLGPHLKSDKVFIVNQVDADTKKFDEHKCLLGYGSLRQALETYSKGFSDGRGLQRIGSVHEISMADFKKWLKSGDTTLPFGSGQKPNIAEERYAKIISTHHAHTEEPWEDYVPAAKAVLEVR